MDIALSRTRWLVPAAPRPDRSSQEGQTSFLRHRRTRRHLDGRLRGLRSGPGDTGPGRWMESSVHLTKNSDVPGQGVSNASDPVRRPY
jgi:hypothetical protein